MGPRSQCNDFDAFIANSEIAQEMEQEFVKSCTEMKMSSFEKAVVQAFPNDSDLGTTQSGSSM